MTELNNLLVKQFQEHNITIYGTFEKPLFKAKEVGDLLGIKNLKDSIREFNNNQKDVAVLTDSIGRQQETIMLTEQGLYKVLMKSRKPVAVTFQDWVCEVIEEIRKTGEYKANKQIEQKTKNTLFIEQYQNKPILYLGMVEHTEEQQIVKYGYTKDTKSTLKRHQLTYGENFHYIYAMESKEHYNLENQIQNHNDLTSRHVKKYNGKDRQELLRLDKNFTVKDLVDLIVKMKVNNEDDRELQLREIDLEEQQEKTKQIQEKTKQMELEVKKLELEIRKLELQQPPTPTEQPPTHTPTPTEQPPTTTPTEQSNIHLVKKFIEATTQFSVKRSDYIFIYELFEKFETWFQEINKPTPTPLTQSMFSKAIAKIPEFCVMRIATGPRQNSVTPRRVAIIHRNYIL